VEAVVIRGDRVSLRPYRPEEAEQLLEHWLSSTWRVGGTADRAAARRRLRQRIARSGRLAGGRLELAIDVDGSVVGDVEARHPPGALPPGVFEIGIEIHDAAERGRGYGSEAITLIAQHLFDMHAAERVQASTAVWNEPMRAVFRRLGFAEEGVMRSFMPTETGRDDFVLYAITRRPPAAP
jgi:RimJ/RimL family protein N-acetyltransferase